MRTYTGMAVLYGFVAGLFLALGWWVPGLIQLGGALYCLVASFCWQTDVIRRRHRCAAVMCSEDGV